MAWGEGLTPSYKERLVAKEEILKDYNHCHDGEYKDRFKQFIESIQEGEELYWYSSNKSHSGVTGYYRKAADGTKPYFNTGAWMS